MNTSLLLAIGGVYGALLVYLFIRFKRGHRRAAITISFFTAFVLFPFIVKGCAYIPWPARLPRVPGIEIFAFILLSMLLWGVLFVMERSAYLLTRFVNLHEAMCFVFPRLHPLLLYAVIGFAGFTWLTAILLAAYVAVES